MSTPTRILFVADAPSAVEALSAIRHGGEVQAQLAPSADALSAALADPAGAAGWDAVVYVPGGPVEEVEVAVFVPDGVTLFVVAEEVPLLLTETAAVALPAADLPGLLARLAAADPVESAPGVDEARPEAFARPVPMEPEVPAPPSPALPEDVPPAPEASPAVADGAPDVDASDQGADSPWLAEASFDAPSEAGAGADPGEAEAPAEAPAPEPVEGAMPAHLASLADHLSIGLYRSAPDGTILYANPALADLLAVDSVAALASLDVRADLGYPREAFAEEIARTGVVRNLVVEWTRRTGERVCTRENARSIVDASGRVVAYEGTMEDITAETEARKEEQTVARQHRAMAGFTAAASLADDPVSIYCSAVGALLDATDASWAALLAEDDLELVATAGAAPDGLASVSAHAHGLTMAPLVVPHTGRGTSQLAMRLREKGVGAFGTVPVRTGADAAGVLLWGYADPRDISATDLRGADGLGSHLGSHLDRVAALQALRDARISLETVTEHTPHVLYRLRYTPNGAVYEYLSPAIETLTGLPRSEVDARGGPGSLVEVRDVRAGEGLATGPVEGEDAYHAIYRMMTAFGPRWVENSGRVWCDAAGRQIGLIGVLQDVTERKMREDDLADAAQGALMRQRALVDLAHLDGADAFGAPAAAIVAATLGASDVSFWLGAPGHPCTPLHAPAPVDPDVDFGGGFASVLQHVELHRALAVADAASDDRVGPLGLAGFVRAFRLRALLVAPIRRRGEVSGFVAIHRTDHPHDWQATETEFAAAVADAVALALEREDRERLVEELVEAREAAEEGRAAAERMNRLKSAFLANMSHEIRTPLTGILGYAEILLAEVPADLRDAVSLIDRNGHRLLDTLNAVLDLSRLEAGEYEADRSPMVLAPEVERAAQRWADAANEKGLRFDLDLDPDVAADVDSDALSQIIGHVVGNAIKFTDAGGVLVTLEGTPAAALLRVADTGRGISEAFVPEAMDAFRQEDTGHARSHEGAGLGLTIARRLAHLLDAEITIESEQPGGTVVTLSLPRVPSPAASPWEHVPALGDGLVPAVPDLLATPPTEDPGDLLGAPFDFTFLSSATPVAAEPTLLASPSSAPTDMFDFRFGRPSASDPAPEPTPPAAVPPPAPLPPPAPPSRPAAPSPAPAAPHATRAGRPETEDPVMIIRARTDDRPTIPAVAPPEDAEIVQEPRGDGKPTILVVEDNDDTRMLLERILRSTYDVTAVGDARSALLAMNQQRFTGLVLDINLGGKETGADVLRIARSLPHYDGVFAIALTAYALPGDRERLLESGFSAYISKPFTRQSLMETLAAGVEA